MKRIATRILLLFAFTLALGACTLTPEDETTWDETLLYGKWKSGTLWYKYVSDGTGKTWDTADDVSEAEAQSFTWTLVQSELTHIHIMQMGTTVPKVYTVTELTSTTLKYKDDFNVSHSFTKVN
ncbi:MAG TPA: hypothetical protein PKJ24_03470 [Prolixibacteraceae bacterium]|nr:hypothetical protein [Prolixibacteraceae bacterium]